VAGFALRFPFTSSVISADIQPLVSDVLNRDLNADKVPARARLRFLVLARLDRGR